MVLRKEEKEEREEEKEKEKEKERRKKEEGRRNIYTVSNTNGISILIEVRLMFYGGKET